jgi:hypothetical protein
MGRRLGACVGIGLVVALGAAPAADAAGKNVSATYPQAPAPKVVKMDNEIGSITVRRGQPAQLVVTKHWNAREPSVDVQRAGDTLTVKADCPQDVGVNDCGVDLALTLPGAFSLDARLGVGTIDVTGVEGTHHLHGGVGDVRVSGTTGDMLTVEAGVGDVALRDLRVKQVTADADSGGIDLDSAIAPDKIDARGNTGSVDVAVPAGAYAVTVDVDHGDTEVRGLVVDMASPRKISAATDIGDVVVRARDGTAVSTTTAPRGRAATPVRQSGAAPSPTSSGQSEAAAGVAQPIAQPLAQSAAEQGEAIEADGLAAADRTDPADDEVGLVALFALAAFLAASALTARVARRRG